MQPRDRLTIKEIQVASLVWQGLTNKDIAAVLKTSEQVVKNYLRTTFDKLGVWTRLELALYVAGHGGASWQRQFGRSVLPVAAWNAAGVNEARSIRGWRQRIATRPLRRRAERRFAAVVLSNQNGRRPGRQGRVRLMQCCDRRC